jgi:beta-lactam-binding protein with PASTA domain
MINGLNSSGAAITIEKVYTESKVAKGSIISQSHSNQIIDYKTTISVVISSGYSVVVPDFVAIDGANHDQAITKDEAIALAEEKGLIIIFIEESNGARLSGEVWHQSIAAGTEVKQGSTITLKHNPKNATLDVADFDGLTQAEVEAHAQYSKLIITFEVGTVQDGYASGLVYNQTIAPSTTVTEGAEVTLTITP